MGRRHRGHRTEPESLFGAPRFAVLPLWSSRRMIGVDMADGLALLHIMDHKRTTLLAPPVLRRRCVGLAQQLLRQAADVYRADHYEELRLRSGG